MPRPSWPEFLRRKREEMAPHHRALVAAATRYEIGDRDAAAKLRRRREGWQEEAWGYVDTVGEVHYALNYRANAIARLRLYAAEAPENTSLGPPETDNETARDAVARISSPQGGQSELLRMLSLNLGVAGECFLIGIAPRGQDNRPLAQDQLDAESRAAAGEIWDVRSIDELKDAGDGRFKLTDIPGWTEPLELTQKDFVARIWRRHPRYAGHADSNMRAVLASCEEILLLERAVRATTKSRIAGTGLLLMPDELSFGSTDITTDNAGDGEGTDDPFYAELLEAMMTPITNEGTASAVVPLLVRGAAEYLDKIRLVTMDRALDPLMEARTTRALMRLAQGLDVPVQVVTGMGDVNHWAAWMIAEDTFQGHIEPEALMICDALTSVYLRPALEAQGMSPIDAAKYRIWYDPARVVVRPNRGDDALKLYANNELSGSSLRRILGFSEEDRPTDDELLTQLVMMGRRIDPTIQAQIMRDTIYPTVQIPEPQSGFVPIGEAPKPLPEDAKLREPPGGGVAPTGPGSLPTTASARIATFARRPARGALGRQLLSIDQNLRSRLHIAADAAMQRALERTGTFLRSKARGNKTARDMLASLGPREVAAALGPERVHAMGLDEHELLAGAFGNIRPQYERWASAASQRALDEIGVDGQDLASAQQAFARDIPAGWNWFESALSSLAASRMYDPTPNAPEVGEFDDSLGVPFGLVRQAVAIAGGAQVENRDGGAVLTIGGDPVGGIATGDTASGAFDATGGDSSGYTWIYGAYPRTHPFEPHESLDGTEFENFDDPALANDYGWPEFDYFIPGDHAGCSCDFMPNWTAASDAGAGAA